MVAGAAASFYFHARGKAAALIAKIATAERDAGEARLKLLETQLEPHMLFNTLANLRALIGARPAAGAVEMLDHLIDYLRATLAASRATHASAGRRVRSPARLPRADVGAHGSAPALRARRCPTRCATLPVPPLLLQPLVENSIRTASSPRSRAAAIRVRARRESDGDGLVRSRSATPASGRRRAAAEGGGFGLTQVRERLATVLRRRAASLTLEAATAGGDARHRRPLPSLTA